MSENWLVDSVQNSFEGFNRFWSRYKKSKIAVVALLTLLGLVITSVFAFDVSPYYFYDITANMKSAPSSDHLFGTDDLGRDILSGVLYSSRVSLYIGFIAAALSSIIGLVIGMIAGYYRGWIDELLMRIADIVIMFPMIFVMLMVLILYGPSVWNLMIIIGILIWPSTARLVRAEFLSLKDQEFVQAARVGGASDFHIIFRHILPNAIHPAIVNGSLQISYAILWEAVISFFGLGDPNNISWGQMLNRALPWLRESWWMALFPGLAISITILCFNLVGDGLNDALNPRLKER